MVLNRLLNHVFIFSHVSIYLDIKAIRLSDTHKGLVQILVQDTWGVICGDSNDKYFGRKFINKNEAKTLCNMLGKR